MTLPTLHLNGSGKRNLADGYMQARDALEAARAALRQTAPNGRDYYPVPGSMDAAVREHWDRLRRLETIEAEILELIVHCDGD